MKKLRVLLAGLLLLSMMAGCESKTESSSHEDSSSTGSINNEEDIIKNEPLTIYNAKHEVIGEIEQYTILGHTDGSIFYTKLLHEIPQIYDSNLPEELEYYRYVIATKENIKLGTMREPSWNYRNIIMTYGDGHVYRTITNEFDRESSYCLDIDLKKNTIREMPWKKFDFSVEDTAAVGNRLLLVNGVKNGHRLEDYDVNTGQSKARMEYSFDNVANTGEIVLKINADETTVSLLILNKGAGVRLRVDVYDHDLKLLRTENVSSISPELSELRLPVAFFDLTNDYFYYQNNCGGRTRFLGKIEGDTVIQLMETDMTFTMAQDMQPNQKTKLFFKSNSEENWLYLLDTENGSITMTKFNAENRQYQLQAVYRDRDDRVLISMGGVDHEMGKMLSPRWYYLNMQELEFHSYDG